MTDKTRDNNVFQKKGVCVAVIPFVEADILVAGSEYLNFPKRTMIQSITSRISTASGTATATLDIYADGVVIVNEMAVTAADVTDETLVAAARYLATGGQLNIRAGAVTPADGALVGELIIEYIEMDKNTGEYTEITNSAV